MRKSVWRQARERWLLPIGFDEIDRLDPYAVCGEGKKQRTRCAASETHADLRALHARVRAQRNGLGERGGLPRNI